MYILRRYTRGDAVFLRKVFYDSVHKVGCEFYTEEEVNAWAPEKYDKEKWEESFKEKLCLVVEKEGEIVAFGDADVEKGYIDRLYVSSGHCGKKIGSLICDELERYMEKGDITVYASKAAKSFFLKRGYSLERENEVERTGTKLTNYFMVKKRKLNLKFF